MSDLRNAAATEAEQLLTKFGDVRAAIAAAGARVQSACDARDRRHWDIVRALLRAHENDERR